MQAIMLLLDASLQLWSGSAGEAVNLARQARSVADRVCDVTLAVQARAFEGRALVSLGRIGEGTEALEQAFSQAEQAEDRESRRIALITNCASAARLGEPERAIRWAARFDGLHDDPSVVGEADLVVSPNQQMNGTNHLPTLRQECQVQIRSQRVAIIGNGGRFVLGGQE